MVANTHKLVIDHCKKVREIPGLEDAILVLSFESNLAYAAPRFPFLLARPT